MLICVIFKLLNLILGGRKLTYKIAICDDEALVREYVESLVEKWAIRYKENIKIESFSSGENFLFHYEEDKKIDILLLDIEMEGINGVELAEKIRTYNREMQIIFVTGYMDYIDRGYDVEALNYLLKPIEENKLYQVLDKALSRLTTSDKSVFLETKEGMVRLALYDISYVEVSGNYISIYSGKKTHISKKTLKEVGDQLDNRFYKINRSILVNLTYVKRISRSEVELKDGSLLALSRGKYDDINKKIIEYF